MKISKILAGSGVALSLALSAGPALAQQHAKTTTTVSTVHGPLKIIPHHKRKICRVRTRHGNTTRKCHYN